MRRTRFVALMLATVASLLSLAVMPVAAEDSSGTSGGTTTNTTETEPPEPANTSDSTEVKSDEEHGSTLLAEMRVHGEVHSEELRQKTCAQRQDEVNNRISNYSAAAVRHLGVINDLFTKVQNFVTDKKLTVPNYATLVASVQTSQTSATTAVDALKALDVKIDCSQPDPAQTLATIKSAVSDARTALQAYRTALKNLIVAIKGASTANSTNKGDND